jgi:phenylacetate-CoA ligase
MHVNIEDVILEVDDEGAAIVTNLASDSFPIIRYRLGDSVAIGSTVCDCGRSHPVIKEIAGRRGHSVIGWTSRYPALTFYYVFKNLAITKGILLNYKATQHEVGRCTLTIEGSEDTNVEKAVREEMRKYFSDDLDYTICYVDRFPTGMKKAQYFESLVNEGR